MRWLLGADCEAWNHVTWLVDTAEAAAQRNTYGFQRVGEPGLEKANEHIHVRVAKL
jgi:hypothetical protein